MEWDGVESARDVIAREYDAGLPRDSVIRSKSETEGGVIASFLRRHDLTSLLDLGVWHGFLLECVLREHSPSRVVAVDAVSTFLESARKRTAGLGNIEWHEALLVPSQLDPESQVIRVDPRDTSKTGVQVSKGPEVHPKVCLSVEDLVARTELMDALESTYVKIDLEGVDIEIVEDFLRLKTLPAVLHFEIVQRERGKYPEIAKRLEAQGYFCPPLEGFHRFHSIACHREEAAIIGFEPQCAYWKRRP